MFLFGILSKSPGVNRPAFVCAWATYPATKAPQAKWLPNPHR